MFEILQFFKNGENTASQFWTLKEAAASLLPITPIKSKIWAFLGLSAVFFCLPLQLKAQEINPAAMLVLDGSGSMWGKIKDGHKILLARKAIAASLRPFDDKIDLGLIAYGHRRRGACHDVQILDRPTPLNSVQLSRLVNQIKPLGKTPITSALEEARKILTRKESGGSIILLADGPENCRRDPCALISPEMAKSKKLKIHVIAFAMEERDAKSLQCLSKNTGGEFHTPKDQLGLLAALTSSLKASVKSDKPAVKAPVVQKKRTKPELRLSAHLGPNNGPLRGGLTWRIVKLGENNEAEATLPPWESNKADPKFELEPGDYRITAGYNDYEVNRDVTLKKNDAISQRLIFNLSQLNLPASWARPDSRSGFGKLLFEPQDKKSAKADALDQKTTVITLTATTQQQLIPAGAYRIVAIENGKIQSWFIHAQPGQAIDLPIWQKTGRIRFELSDASTKKPLNKPTLRIYPVKNGEALEKESARSAALNPQFDLEAGEYIAEIEDGLAALRHPFTIKTGEVTTAEIAVERALLAIDLKNTSAASNPVLDILEVRGKNKLFHRGELSNLDEKITLTPGRYRLILRSSPTARAIIKDITLKAGDEQTVRFAAQDAAISFLISDREDPLSRHQIFWRLNDKSGAVIWQSPDPAPILSLSAGEYTILAEIGSERYKQTFRVKSQQSQTIDLAGALIK